MAGAITEEELPGRKRDHDEFREQVRVRVEPAFAE